jgi:uncharacterized protein (DUF488 family)
MNKLFTVGHSTHPISKLIELLVTNHVTTVCDVRSQPYSRYNPQFNRESLERDLEPESIQYVFLGRELGARSEDPSCYDNGRVVYGRIAKTELFRQGIERVTELLHNQNVALLCAEKDPLTCHRTILVAQALANIGIEANHILENGSVETYRNAIERLRREEKLRNNDLFRSQADLDAEAFQSRELKIAYRQTSEEPGEKA